MKRFIDDCNEFLENICSKTIQEAKNNPNLYQKLSYAYFCLATTQIKSKKFDLALENLKQAQMYAKDDYELYHIYNYMGLVYKSKNDIENALLYFNLSLDLAKKLKDSELETIQLHLANKL